MKLEHVVRTVLAAVAVGFLIYYVDPSAMAAALAGADPWWIATAVALLPANVMLETVLWHILVRRARPATTFREAFEALLAGHSLGFFTPGRAGEVAGRAFYVKHADRWETAAVVIVQRFYDMAAAVSVGTIALFLFRMEHALPAARVWLGIGVVGALIGGGLVAAGVAPAAARRVLVRVLPRSWRGRIDFLDKLTPPDGIRLLGLALTRYAVYVTQFFLLLRALEPAAGAAAAYVGIGLVFLAKFLIPPITFMDLGIREGAAVFFLGRMGFSEAAALNASLMLFTVNLLLPAAAGIWYVMKLRLGAEAGPPSNPERHSR